MDFLNLMLQPQGFWHNIIFGLEAGVGDYALTLILITVIIRFLLLPFDFMNKYIMKNSTRKQAKLKPQLDKLEKMYSSNPQLLNQKRMELYKRENFSIGGTCLGMIVYMVVTSIVFFTLFGALNSIATYKQVSQYQTLEATYYESVLTQEGHNVATLNQEEINALITNLTEEQLTAANEVASQAVKDNYKEIRSNFLWIKNIWKADTTTEAILTYKEYKKVAGEESTVTEAQYNRIMEPVKQEFGGPNGYYLLIVLSALTTYASMQLTVWINKAKAKKKGQVYADPAGTNKILNYVMPIVMGLFTLFYNAAFGIYIVAGSLFMLITAPITNLVVDHLDAKKEAKEQEKITVSYSRKK